LPVATIADDDRPAGGPRGVDLPELQRGPLEPHPDQRAKVIDARGQTKPVDRICLSREVITQGRGMR
jgi:hypothetical protein